MKLLEETGVVSLIIVAEMATTPPAPGSGIQVVGADGNSRDLPSLLPYRVLLSVMG